MVVKLRPCSSEPGTWQDRTASPFSSTVHAPHTPTPQPNLVPVRPNLSRRIQSNGVSSSISTTCLAPLILTSAFIRLLEWGQALIRRQRDVMTIPGHIVGAQFSPSRTKMRQFLTFDVSDREN